MGDLFKGIATFTVLGLLYHTLFIHTTPQYIVEIRNELYSPIELSVGSDGKLHLKRYIRLIIKHDPIKMEDEDVPINKIEVFDIGIKDNEAIIEVLDPGKIKPVISDGNESYNVKLNTVFSRNKRERKGNSDYYYHSTIKFPIIIKPDQVAELYILISSRLHVNSSDTRKLINLVKNNPDARHWSGFLNNSMDKLGCYRKVKLKGRSQPVILPGPQIDTLLVKVHSSFWRTEEAVLY